MQRIVDKKRSLEHCFDIAVGIDERPMSMVPIHLLLVEDSAAEAHFICSLFDDSFSLSRVSTMSEGLDALRSRWFDCALLDYRLPDGDAIDMLEVLERESCPIPPVVVLTGEGSEGIAVAAFRHGATDYLRKQGLSAEILRQAVRDAARARRFAPPSPGGGGLRPGEAERLLEEIHRAMLNEIQPPIRFANGMMRELHARLKNLDPGSSDLLEQLRQQTHRLNELIRNLVRFERLRLVPALACAVEPADAVAIALFGADREFMAPGALEIEPLPPVLLPPYQLVELFRELLENSACFRGGNALRVRLSAERCGGMVTFTLDDDGEGIPASASERVFGLFEKLHAAGEGTGVGLALARRIVNLHGGQIWSEPKERGARIRFTLPAAEMSPAEPAALH